MTVTDVIRELPMPNYKLVQVKPEMDEDQRTKALDGNLKDRILYIHNTCGERFPAIYEMFRDVAIKDVLEKWAQTLTDPDDRVVLEAAKTRAIAYEQRPPQFVELGLTDLDFIDSQVSLEVLKHSNKNVESSVNSPEFKAMSKEDRRLFITNLIKKRDADIHPLVFILTLNINDLSRDSKRKLNALHALGKHKDAVKIGEDSIRELQKKAIADYRSSIVNNTIFPKAAYRSFS